MVRAFVREEGIDVYGLALCKIQKFGHMVYPFLQVTFFPFFLEADNTVSYPSEKQAAVGIAAEQVVLYVSIPQGAEALQMILFTFIIYIRIIRVDILRSPCIIEHGVYRYYGVVLLRLLYQPQVTIADGFVSGTQQSLVELVQ